jgi:hypothetical protein
MESKCAETSTCPIWSPTYATVSRIWSSNIGPSLTKMESLSPSKIMSASLTLGTLHRLPSSVSCTAQKKHPSCARQLPPWQRLGTSTRSPTDAGYLKPYLPLNPIRSTYKTSTISYGAFAFVFCSSKFVVLCFIFRHMDWVAAKIGIKFIPPKFIIYLFRVYTNLAQLLV